ncbi:MAG: MFS transporter [Thermoplasmata archaeon]|nr:MAG: MFS transporter [Thermoplasmata archaeon]
MGKLGKDIILLGWISFFTDMSSEAMMPVLPFFISTLHGVSSIGSGFALGLIMGFGTAMASIVNFLSGIASDRIGRRKIFISAGYTTSAISKLFFPLSQAWWHLFALVGIERTGKGLRGAPRDAFIGERYKEERGRAFGFHRAMDTAGAIAGSILAFIFLWVFKLDYRQILLIAAIIAFFAIPPIYMLKEKRKEGKREKIEINSSIKKFTFVATIFYLGNFTYGFFLLRASKVFNKFGLNGAAIAILMYMLFNIVYASLSMHFGKLSDKIGRRFIITIGYILFAFTCIGFMLLSYIAENFAIVLTIILFILYGMVYALIEGNQRAYAADLSEWKGTSQGVFKASTGLATLPAGIIAGILWDIMHDLTFIYGAVLAILAASLLATMRIEKD